jgi:hypothetical protein
LEPIASKVENFISDPKTFNLMLEYHQCVSTHPSAPSRMNFERHLMLSWPAYNWMKMMGKGDRIIADLVNAFSQTCGWPNIEKGECMMIGCCWNIDKENCNHATDLTKIPSETLVKVAGMLMLSTGDKEEEDTTDGGATPPGLSTGQRFGNFGAPPPLNSAPSSGASPPFSLPGPLPGALGGLTGRRRRNAVKRRKRRQFQNPLAMQLTPQQLLIQQLMNGGNAQPQQPTAQQLMQQQLAFNMMNPNQGGAALGGAAQGSAAASGLSMGATFRGLNPFGNMMGAFSDQQECAAANPILNCMEPFDEGKQPDFSALIDGKNKCQVKGCCWDNNIQTSILLGNANSAFDQLNQHQCEWKTPTIGSNWGFPDLTQSYRGCCTRSPCVHTEVPAEWTEWGDWTTCSHQVTYTGMCNAILYNFEVEYLGHFLMKFFFRIVLEY